MKRILITGASGFVGRILSSQALSQGWQVHGSVRSAKHVSSLPAEVKTVQINSIDGDTDWSRSLAGVDTIVHLAAHVHVMHDISTDSLSAFHLVNAVGTERLARQAADAGVRRFIYLSSVKVNGEESAVAYTENDAPAPLDPYGKSKWEAEQALRDVSASSVMEVIILRPPLVYGPGVKANFLQLMKIVNRGIPLPLASVQNKRSIIYLGNLIDAIMTCTNHHKAAGQTFLVSDCEDVSTPDLIRRLATALGRKSRLLPFHPTLLRLAGKLSGKSTEVERLLGSLTVDTTKIRRELGWKPPYTMEQGLRETAEWFKNKL